MTVEVAAAALDLHEGISASGGCQRWPEHYRLRNQATGEVVRGRCKATNLCRYCQQLYVLETVEMLRLDACEYAPALWMVLTAREHLTRKDTHGILHDLRRHLRGRWPDIEWFVQVEFQRRGALHLNLLIKGVPVEDREQLRQAAAERWCSRVDAEPVGQWVGEIPEPVGLVRYLQKTLSHGLKAEQAPPVGWRGHRTSQTRGYLVRPAAVMRREARESMKRQREVWKAKQRGLMGLEADQAADLALLEQAAASWSLWQLPNTGSGLIGARPAPKDGPRRHFAEFRRRDGDRLELRRLLADLEAGNPPPAQSRLRL